MTVLSANLQAVLQRIEAACRSAGRAAGSVRLLAVSKTFPASAVAELAAAGQLAFGENYVQEACAKASALAAAALEWHFIGPLQSNKTQAVAQHMHWVHSIDRAKIAERLALQRPAQMPALQVCLQVNVSAEASKSGVAPEALPALARAVLGQPQLRLRGLMAIPEASAEHALLARRFAQVRELRDELANNLGLELDTLSMGMSADLESAIAEGATIVRVGSALFGPRGSHPHPLPICETP